MISLHIDRILPGPPERVWRALTDAAALAAWFWPRHLEPAATTDPRPGGRFRIAAARGPSGEPASGFAVEGEYTVVRPPERLVFTWRWEGDPEETLVTIELSAVDTGTALRLTHERFGDDAARDNHLVGWTDCLDRLPAWLTQVSPSPLI